jgi:exodeoxyribonuclease VII small subunit
LRAALCKLFEEKGGNMSKESNYEKQFKRLQEIAEKLENEELGLEETFKLFQEGMQLGKECKKALSEIEEKVNEILSANEDKEENIENTENGISF